jgi:hypothetical protein
MTGADEETAGTSAINPNECFRVNSPATPVSSGLIPLSWHSVVGRRYTVESTPTLLPPAWQPIPDLSDLPGTGASISVDLPVNGPSLFFRILVRKP